MVPTDIKVGTRGYVRVSATTIAFIEVIQDLNVPGRRYIVRRVDNGRILSRPRSAEALHDTPGPWQVPEGLQVFVDARRKAASERPMQPPSPPKTKSGQWQWVENPPQLQPKKQQSRA